MFNKAKKAQKKKETDLTKERESRCVPAAEAITKVMGDAPIAKTQAVNMFKEYVPKSHEVLDILKEHNIKTSEIPYVFQLALTPLKFVQEMVEQSLQKHIETTEEMFWGKTINDVTVSELDAKLKESKLPSLE